MSATSEIMIGAFCLQLTNILFYDLQTVRNKFKVSFIIFSIVMNEIHFNSENEGLATECYHYCTSGVHNFKLEMACYKSGVNDIALLDTKHDEKFPSHLLPS